ncbi:MAG: mechanosensitive ion channel family protein [Alphaproteobacteria bacterium]
MDRLVARVTRSAIRSGLAKGFAATVLLLAVASFSSHGAVAKSAFPDMPGLESTAPQKNGPQGTLADDLSADIDAAEQSFDDMIRDLRAGLREAAVSGHNLSATLTAAVRGSGEDGTSDWLMPALEVGVIALLCGWAVALLFRWWARRRFLGGFSAHPSDRYGKIAYQLTGGVIAFVATLLFAFVGWAVSEYAQGDRDMAYRTVMIMIATAACTQLLLTVIYGLLSPGNGAQRVIAMEDRHARSLAIALTLVSILGGVLFGINAWFKSVELDDPTHDLFSIITTGVAIVLLSAVCIAYRGSVANAILPADSEASGWKRWLARHWYVIGIAYFVVAWLARAVRVLLDRPNAEGLVAIPFLALLVGLAVYGITLLIVARFMKGGVELHMGGPNGRRLPNHRDLVERGAAIAYIAIGLAVIFHVWGIGVVGGGAWGGRVFDALVVVFFGWILYDAAKLTIDRKIAAEDPTDAMAGQDVEGDVPMATAKTRLATLLPLVRVLVLSTITVTIVMMALAQVGVNITPLFAGAGVVGLAIGFGSRQLVEDVISGAFYLADDAFRVGEYLDIGKVKGTVERISVRSFQLRHQNGPLNTIRFGEVSHVINFSRDWAIMKLPIRVPLDADSEKIRKIIKKVGEELQNDPELGPKFLQPLKSQGVYQMDDSALIIRVKFMTRPNDQFILRRVVYHRIQEAFHKAGIRFANRVVTVRVEGDDAEPASPAVAAHRRQTIAAAASDAIGDGPAKRD